MPRGSKGTFNYYVRQFRRVYTVHILLWSLIWGWGESEEVGTLVHEISFTL